MMLIEGQLILAGHNHIVALIGNNLSVEIKLSRHSLLVFEVCKNFQLILYEVPYINLPAQNIIDLRPINETLKT